MEEEALGFQEEGQPETCWMRGCGVLGRKQAALGVLSPLCGRRINCP